MSIKVTKLDESTCETNTGDESVLGTCDNGSGRLHTIQAIVSIQGKGDFGKCIHCAHWIDMFSGEDAPIELIDQLNEAEESCLN